MVPRRTFHFFTAVAVLFPAALASAQTNDFNHFLKMDVCLDQPGGNVIAEIPGVNACVNRREAGVADRLPYFLQLFGAVEDAGNCAKQDGWIRKINVPVTFNGKSRIASYFDKGYSEPCNVNYVVRFGQMDDEGDKISIYNPDANWGSIYYSRSDRGGTFYHTPTSYLLAGQSEQFKNGWILAPRTLPARQPGGAATVGAQLFRSHQYSGDPAEVFDVFPTTFNKALTLWARADFEYRSGHTFDSVISFHYSGDNANTKLHPGNAKSLEKLYFTDEFGLVRWETWKREDWSQYAARDRAIEYRINKNRCSTPFDLPYDATADMITGTIGNDEGAFYEVVRVAGDLNSGKRWYMTDCFDYTNFKLNSSVSQEQNYNPAGYRPDISGILNDGGMLYYFR